MIEVIVCVGIGYALARTCHDHIIDGVIKPTVKAIKRVCKNVADG